jgi:hypothetical protein
MSIKYLSLLFFVLGALQIKADTIPTVAAANGIAESGLAPAYFSTNQEFATFGGDTLVVSSSYTDGLTSALATANIAGDPTVSASSNGTSAAEAELTYYFEVVGTPGTNVLVDVSGALAATSNVVGDGNNTAQANILVDSPGTGQTFLYLGACNSNCVGPSFTFVGSGEAFNDALLIPSDVVITVQMAALAESNETDTSDTFNASVDPFIQIDPTFLAGNPGYSLVLSQDIVNEPLSGVPEPRTTGIMLLGLLAVVIVGKRKLQRVRKIWGLNS